MPCQSERSRLLGRVDTLKLDVIIQRKENLQHCVNKKEEENLDNWDDDDDGANLIFISPLPTPIFPFLSNLESKGSNKSLESTSPMDVGNWLL